MIHNIAVMDVNTIKLFRLRNLVSPPPPPRPLPAIRRAAGEITELLKVSQVIHRIHNAEIWWNETRSDHVLPDIWITRTLQLRFLSRFLHYKPHFQILQSRCDDVVEKKMASGGKMISNYLGAFVGIILAVAQGQTKIRHKLTKKN